MPQLHRETVSNAPVIAISLKKTFWIIGVVLFWLAATLSWSFFSGKDLNWDQLNYHFYTGYSLAADRLGKDFMAANVQSFLNPLAYFPFYWMVSNQWHSLLIASVLSTVHAFNIILSYGLVRAALARASGTRIVAMLGAALAFLSPIFLLEAGTTFADITTSVLVIGGLLLCLHTDKSGSWLTYGSLVAGVCIGVAAGLKLPNLIYLPCGTLALAIVATNRRSRLLSVVIFGLGAVMGLVAAHGYWSWRLWEEFRNPVLPLLNEFFRSSDYPQITHDFSRFRPTSWLDGVLLPFRMMQLRSWVYVETTVPDLRFAALILGLIIGGLVFVRRLDRASALLTKHRRALAFVGFFCAAYALWVCTSGNGRYGIAISVLCGPLIAVLCYALSKKNSVASALLVALALLQIVHLRNSDLHFSRGPWTETWYEVSTADQLREQAYLYVNVGMASNSYVLPFLADGSAFTNPIGQMPIDLQGPGGKRLQRLYDSFPGRIRVISLSQSVQNGNLASLENWAHGVNTMVSRLGLQVDSSDCLAIRTSGSGREAGVDFTEKDAAVRRLLACEATLLPLDDEQIAERARIKQIFVKITAWCPRLFQPHHTVVEKSPNGWYSPYADTDSTLHLEADRLFVSGAHADTTIYLGSVRDWQDGTPAIACDQMPKRLRDL